MASPLTIEANDPRAIFLSYKGFSANETSFKRLQRYYDAQAEDRSRIFYTFLRSRMSILIIVHERIPLKNFTSLLLRFFKEKPSADFIGGDEVEIRVVKREENDMKDLEDDDDDDDDWVVVEEVGQEDEVAISP